MADDVVIRAERLGKRYQIRHQSPERYTALRDVIVRSATQFSRTARDFMMGRPIFAGEVVEEFWALNEVSFEIIRGDVIGIIGRNGAGKSTLLKILSRITEPSCGRVQIKGRVASLLEVGTGFHPELSGRENIYLNGAILGMKRAEIKRNFDEIVAFAGVEKFLDTPVKRYSSGMYVRLAFAVAAHLETEVVIVDEVLAVGDAEFQKKCLGKIGEVAESGRTVLFVSHNMGAVQALCQNVILLDAGNIRAAGQTKAIVSEYLAGFREPANTAVRNMSTDSAVAIETCSVEVLRPQHGELQMKSCIKLRVREPASIALELAIRDGTGSTVGFASIGALDSRKKLVLSFGQYNVVSLHDISILADGEYSITIMVSRPDIEYLDIWEDCLRFDLSEAPGNGAERRMQQRWGFGSVEFSYLSHQVEIKPDGN